MRPFGSLPIDDSSALHDSLCNDTDSLAWAGLLTLEHGIGPRFIDHVYDRAKSEECCFSEALMRGFAENFDGVSGPVRARAWRLVQGILSWLEAHELRDGVPAEGWGNWMLSLGRDEENTEASRAFRQLLQEIDAITESEVTLERYVSQIAPLGRDLAQSQSDGVRIMTMASSKGLTVRASVIVAVREGIIPHARASRSEERRLLYVAMTRSRDFLFLTWARRRTGPAARRQG